jgi:hypothetical protein
MTLQAAACPAPTPAAQRAMLGFAIAAGLLSLIAHEAIAASAEWFRGTPLRTAWYTLTLLPAMMAMLTVQQLDRRFAQALAAYTLLLAYLAWYAGRAVAPPGVAEDPVLVPFVMVLIASGHVLAAWLSCHFARQGFSYPRLFESAWGHTTTLMQLGAYVLAFWLLLFLWAALFRALKVEFFQELFREPRFIYPVTSLMCGFGLVIARTRSHLGDAVHLRILALWRGLLPLAAALAIAFTLGVLTQGVQALWDTRHATQLLLSLMVALVVLANAAYGKGGESAPHPITRWLTRIALLLLPLFAALAAVALALRWQQYGMSLDRLWAALSVIIASVYAVGYAAAAYRGGAPWLAGIAPVNRATSLLSLVLLTATQTGLLDFRAMTAHALRERGAALSDEDLRYLRWELGSPGVTALESIRNQLPAQDAARAAAITTLLAQTTRWGDNAEAEPHTPDLRYQQPVGAEAPPSELLAALTAHAPPAGHRDALAAAGREFWLLKAELDRQPPAEWMRLSFHPDSEQDRAIQIEVFAWQQERWQPAVSERLWLQDPARFAATVAAIRQGLVRAELPRWQELILGEERQRLESDRP